MISNSWVNITNIIPGAHGWKQLLWRTEGFFEKGGPEEVQREVASWAYLLERRWDSERIRYSVIFIVNVGLSM